MNDQKWLADSKVADNSRLEEKIYTTQPPYLIQDSTITTAIDIRRSIVSVINIKPSKHLPNQHALSLQPARQSFLKIKLARYFRGIFG